MTRTEVIEKIENVKAHLDFLLATKLVDPTYAYNRYVRLLGILKYMELKEQHNNNNYNQRTGTRKFNV